MLDNTNYTNNYANNKVMKIRRKDIKTRDPYWKLASFKRVHKSKKVYNRKNKHKNGEE